METHNMSKNKIKYIQNEITSLGNKTTTQKEKIAKAKAKLLKLLPKAYLFKNKIVWKTEWITPVVYSYVVDVHPLSGFFQSLAMENQKWELKLELGRMYPSWIPFIETDWVQSANGGEQNYQLDGISNSVGFQIGEEYNDGSVDVRVYMKKSLTRVAENLEFEYHDLGGNHRTRIFYEEFYVIKDAKPIISLEIPYDYY